MYFHLDILRGVQRWYCEPKVSMELEGHRRHRGHRLKPEPFWERNNKKKVYVSLKAMYINTICVCFSPPSSKYAVFLCHQRVFQVAGYPCTSVCRNLLFFQGSLQCFRAALAITKCSLNREKIKEANLDTSSWEIGRRTQW